MCFYVIYLSIKDLENLTKLQNLHLYTQKTACTTNFRPFQDIDANFYQQLSSQQGKLKIKIKNIDKKQMCKT